MPMVIQSCFDIFLVRQAKTLSKHPRGSCDMETEMINEM